MDITIYKMDDEYVCSSEADADLDFEDICRKLVSFKLKGFLLEAVPRLKEKEDEIEIKVEWMYEGYRVYVFGDKLNDTEMEAFVERIDPVKNIGICDLFWNKYSEQREYTGVVLAYDFRHYHKFVVGAHRFLVLTYNGIEEFLKALGMVSRILPMENGNEFGKLHFAHDKDKEKEIQKNRLIDAYAPPQVEIRRRGRMHARDLENGFSTYWDKRFGKK